jgi:glycosyltransferase involved in cell wall biosynthesis
LEDSSRQTVRRPQRVLLLTLDAVGARVGGAAIRCLGLARALSTAGHTAIVATPSLLPDASSTPFPIIQFDRSRARESLRPLLQACDLVLLPFHALVEMPFLSRLQVPLVIDIYDPILLEVLEIESQKPLATRRRAVRAQATILAQLLRRGDFFLCASERQRDMWLGALLLAGRIVPTERGDPSFRHLIDVVPFGLTGDSVVSPGTSPVLKGVYPGIRPGDTVLAWGGAIWDWLDPLTLIRAVASLTQRLPDLHLVFLGGNPPGTVVEPRPVVLQAHHLASELGVKDRNVHFFEGWIPYAEVGRYLLECDAGVTIHTQSLESRFAFRTRVLDYLSAALPIICTEGDVLAELIQDEGLGVVVPEGDEAALTAAIERVARDPEFTAACRSRIDQIRPKLTWDLAALPLIRWCDALPTAGGSQYGSARLSETWHLVASAWRVLASQGPREVIRRIRLHLQLRA